jgi:sugar-specific transcriptional regulator TrmB
MNTSLVGGLNLVVDSKEIMGLVEKFKKYAKKTAEGVLEMAKVACEAKKLKESEFHKFCEIVGMSGSSSTIQKLIKIGEKYEFFIGHAEKLPANWTTVYELSKLTSEKIEELIDRGVVCTTLIASDLNMALGKPVKEKDKKPVTVIPNGNIDGLGFRVQLNKSPDAETIKKIKELIAELKKFDLQLEVGTTLNAFFAV